MLLIRCFVYPPYADTLAFYDDDHHGLAVIVVPIYLSTLTEYGVRHTMCVVGSVYIEPSRRP